MGKKYKNIERYNRLWKAKKIQSPIVILLGGYAGTGKSTIANKLLKLIKYQNIFPTGIIRATLKDYISPKDNPYLYEHTWNLHELSNNLEDAYIKHSTPIVKAINKAIEFSMTEKQMFIFDGNHVIPGLMNPKKNLNIIEVYLYVKSPKKHLEMLCGPTHNRSLCEKQFKTARILHDYIVKEARSNKKKLIESTKATDKAIEYIDKEIGKILEISH